jgi:outer membrane protein assembly factor BamB
VFSFISTHRAKTEDELYAAGSEQLNQKKFIEAEKSFKELRSSFPHSPRAKEYQVLEQMSQVLQSAGIVGRDPIEAWEELNHFLDEIEQDEKLVREFHRPIQEVLDKVTEDLVANARQYLSSPVDMTQVRLSLAASKAAQAKKKSFGGGENPGIIQGWQDLEITLAKAERRFAALQQLKRLPGTLLGVQNAEKLIERNELQADSEAIGMLANLKTMVFSQVAYVAAPDTPDKVKTTRQSARERGLVVAPEVSPPVGNRTGEEGVVFALARGVLYALAKRDGRFLWAARLGIDTTALPVRLPASEIAGEMVLVLSSDTSTMTARDVLTGEERWRRELQAPCLGRPVVVGPNVYVPTYDGKIHEIDRVSGQLLGWYQVSSALTVGGTHQEGTELVYFPADSLVVYVLDVKKHQCVGILQSGHASGSLRGAPLIISPDLADPNPAVAAERPHYLVLNEADGLSAMKLKAYPLPIENVALVPPLEPVMRIRGWSWFEPHCDGEKIALATDLGEFGLFGINQRLNRDTPLFRLLPEEGKPNSKAQDRQLGRAQVVHAEESDFWILLGGRLKRWQLVIDREKGLRIKERWQLPLRLGSPLHSGQVSENRDTLFVVTRSANQQGCLAIAVDSETGQIRWQRRLGMVCRGDPLVISDKVLAQDREGGLFLFDPARDITTKEEWRIGGQLLSPPVQDAENRLSHLLLGSDSQSACAVISARNGRQVLIRRIEIGKPMMSKTFLLPPAVHLAGTPAVGPDHLILPLSDGSLLWQGLDGKDRQGGKWLGSRVGQNAEGHVVYIGPDEFLTTDGNRGWTRWRWPDNEGTKEVKSGELADRIVATPILLSQRRQACFADSAGTVWLFQLPEMTPVRQWAVGGKITSGPYLFGDRIGCVVDQRRLVWMDPGRQQFLEYSTSGEAIVGHPQLAGGMLVVADLSGQIIGVDPATGKLLGRGYSIKSSVALAATPVAFGAAQLFVPLTDGTILLIPLTYLRSSS